MFGMVRVCRRSRIDTLNLGIRAIGVELVRITLNLRRRKLRQRLFCRSGCRGDRMTRSRATSRLGVFVPSERRVTCWYRHLRRGDRPAFPAYRRDGPRWRFPSSLSSSLRGQCVCPDRAGAYQRRQISPSPLHAYTSSSCPKHVSKRFGSVFDPPISRKERPLDECVLGWSSNGVDARRSA